MKLKNLICGVIVLIIISGLTSCMNNDDPAPYGGSVVYISSKYVEDEIQYSLVINSQGVHAIFSRIDILMPNGNSLTLEPDDPSYSYSSYQSPYSTVKPPAGAYTSTFYFPDGQTFQSVTSLLGTVIFPPEVTSCEYQSVNNSISIDWEGGQNITAYDVSMYEPGGKHVFTSIVNNYLTITSEKTYYVINQSVGAWSESPHNGQYYIIVTAYNLSQTNVIRAISVSEKINVTWGTVQ